VVITGDPTVFLFLVKVRNQLIYTVVQASRGCRERNTEMKNFTLTRAPLTLFKRVLISQAEVLVYQKVGKCVP